MKLMWCSDFVDMPTGYAQVTRNILYRMQLAGHDILHQSFHLPHPMMPKASQIPRNYKVVWPINWNEFYGNQESIQQNAAAFKPDILSFLGDHFMFKWFFDEKSTGDPDKRVVIRKIDELKKVAKKLLFYFPFDSDTVYEGAQEVMEVMDYKLEMCHWGQKVLKDQTGLDSIIIPHGYDPAIYRPLSAENKMELRKPQKWEGKFIVGSVARNQSRKLLTLLIKAFSKFAEDKPEAILFLHCDPKDPQGTNLEDVVKRLGLKEKVYFGMQRYDIGVQDNQVNYAYNTMDMHVLPTTGEGFGLPILESMAAGVPNIATNYTSCIELIQGHGELVKVAGMIPGQYNTNRALIDIDDLVKKMDKLYHKPELREQYSKDGMEFARKHFTWDKIIPMWLELFEHGKVKEEYSAHKELEKR